jgi:hypothetical protein
MLSAERRSGLRRLVLRGFKAGVKARWHDLRHTAGMRTVRASGKAVEVMQLCICRGRSTRQHTVEGAKVLAKRYLICAN